MSGVTLRAPILADAAMRDLEASLAALLRSSEKAAAAWREMVRELTTCKEHGPMRWREREMAFTCAGFDGEGCPSRLDVQ